jgi:hypothetical protein
VWKKVCGPKGEVTEGWRKLHSDEHHNLYSSPNIIRLIISRVIKMAWECGKHAIDEKCIWHFDQETRRKSSPGKPGYRWEDNIILDLTPLHSLQVPAHCTGDSFTFTR